MVSWARDAQLRESERAFIMATLTKSKRNFTEGPLFIRIFTFTLPILMTGLLQMCYNMADHIVVGKFSGDEYALAAVGSTAALTHLIINLLMGVALGSGVVTSQLFGAKREGEVSRAVHTAISVAIIGGLLFSAIGIFVSEPALILMRTKPEILSRSVLYLRIICLGIPASAVYNFAASIFRSVGDSRTPLIVLSLAGLANVLLNIMFVVAFGMAAEGVAIATIISQYASAVALLVILNRRKGECYTFSARKLAIDGKLLKRILYCGIPTGVQSSLFSLSNVFMMSAANTFPTATVTAKTIADNIDSITYICMNSFAQAAMTFTGQNYGALKRNRIKKVAIYSLIQVFVVGIIVSGLEIVFAEPFANLFIDSEVANRKEVLAIASDYMRFLLSCYFLCGLMDVLSGTVRGLGYSTAPMMISLFSICGVRMFWIFVVFPNIEFSTLKSLATCYPISWGLALAIFAVFAVFAIRKLYKNPEFNDSK
jgi:putative MATE family efflux protein